MEIVTISRNKITGDRSFTHGYFQIVSRNKSHVRVKALQDDFWGVMTDKTDMLLTADEFDFFDARPLLSKEEYASLLLRAIFV